MRHRDDQKRERVKRAVIRLVLLEGINGASVSKIAREADVSPATIYVYYASKEEMLADVFVQCQAMPYERMKDDISRCSDARNLVLCLLRGFYRFNAEHEDIFSFVEQCSRCPSLSRLVYERRLCADIMDAIRSYQDRGEIKKLDCQVIMALLFAPIRFLMASECQGERRDLRFEQLADAIADTLLQ